MNHLLSILLTAILCATASAQTIKTLGYNATNGQVVVATNVVWTNSFSFSTNTVAASVRANLGFSTNLNTLWTATNASNARTAIGLAATNEVTFATVYLGKIFVTESGEIEFEDEPTAAGFRTNLGLPLPALTNTSNVTMMRALAGSTNTNQPYSGSIIVQEQGVNDTVTITISNGIIVSIVQ